MSEVSFWDVIQDTLKAREDVSLISVAFELGA